MKLVIRKSGIMIEANASVKNIARPKNVILGILAHAFVRIVNN